MNQEQINNYLKNNDPEITSLKNEQERIKLEYQNIEDVSESNKVLELFDDYVSFNGSGGNSYSRPAVTLKSGSVITEGDGTQERPYVID